MCCSMFWDGMTGRQCDILSHSPAHRQRDSPLLTVVTRTMKTTYKYRTQYATVHYSLIKNKSIRTVCTFLSPKLCTTIHHLHHWNCIYDRINISNSIKTSTKINILISVNTNAKTKLTHLTVNLYLIKFQNFLCDKLTHSHIFCLNQMKYEWITRKTWVTQMEEKAHGQDTKEQRAWIT